MRRSLSLLLALGALAILASPVAAQRPERVFLEAEDFELPAGLVCDFTVRIEFVVNNEYGLFFPTAGDGTAKMRVTGHLVQRIVNVDTNESIVVNVSGPGDTITAADGSFTIRARGRSSIWMFPGEPHGPGLWLTTGPLRMEFDAAGNLLRADLPANVQDICALLAS